MAGGPGAVLRAWLFDVYPAAEGMVLWFLDEGGRPHRLRLEYHPAFYAAGPRAAQDRLGRTLAAQGIGADLAPTGRQELFSGAEVPVVRVAVHRPVQFPAAVRQAATIPALTLYTCDLSAAQLFLYESGLFPLGLYDIAATDGVAREITPLSRPEDLEYATPPFVVMRLRLDGDPVNPAHGWRSELAVAVAGEEVVLTGERPEDLIHSLNRLLGRYDPDVLLTDWGDAFLLPRLLRLSQRAGVPLALNRDPQAGIGIRRDRSYMTYGKTVYQAGARVLHGRWHLDLRNSFIYSESEMAGLLEIARLSRLPVQRLGRTSTGTAISSMQLARAVQQGILVPWHKSEPEGFKTAEELLRTDKGGLTYQPIVGVFEGVGELDFTSMYPTIMARFNVSPETINCGCCPDGEVVPEIGHTVCQRRRGLVPQVLDHLLERRAYYKKRKRETTGAERALYDQRQTALKWCLVTCLAGRTKVLYQHQNRWKIAPIREIVDAYLPGDRYGEVPADDLFVTGIDENLKTVVKQVRSVIKSPVPSTMIRMRLRWGREMVMTPNHRCYVLQNGQLKSKRADELKVGDWVPLALTWDGVVLQGAGEIDLIQELKQRLTREEQKRWRVFGPAVQGLVRANWREMFRKAGPEYCAKTIWNWREYGYMPLSHLEPGQFTGEERRDLRIGRGKLTGGIIQKLPASVKIDEDLAFLLGFFVGDGSYTGKGIRFDVGGNEYGHLLRLRRILGRKFREVFGLAGSADRGKLRIPEIILNGPRRARRGFLLGLVGSDGHIGRSANCIRIASADASFVRDLGFLLTSLGVDHRFVHHGHLYVIETKNLRETAKLVADGRLLSAKHRKAFRYRQSVGRYGRLSQIPVKASGLLRLSKQAQVVRVLRQTHQEKQFAEELGHFRRLIKSSLIFAPVVSLEQVAPDERFVYCFGLAHAPTAFFIEGGILTSNSFGYLGFRNARYGRIEAHESTTAYSREMLLRAKDLAEAQGFRMLHALVDSMWLQKPGAGAQAYAALTREIERVTNLPVYVEGVYNWVAFLPSRLHPGVGVPNRYMGVFQDGSTKVRGIEVRRSDVPALVEAMQARMLQEMFAAPTIAALQARLPPVLGILEEALVRLREGSVGPHDLALTATISQEPQGYRSNHPIALAARLMAKSGIRLHPGEAIQYVVVDADAKIREERVRPATLLGTDWTYDQDYYAELLVRAAETVLEPFGYTRERLWDEVWEPLRPVTPGRSGRRRDGKAPG